MLEEPLEEYAHYGIQRSYLFQTRQLENIGSTLYSMIPRQVYRYTWTKKQTWPSHIAEHLDRLLILKLPLSQRFLSSDQKFSQQLCPIISLSFFILSKQRITNRPPSISILYGCNPKERGQQSSKPGPRGSPSFVWEQKLKSVKRSLRLQAKSSYISPSKARKTCKEKLHNLQCQMEDEVYTKDLQLQEQALATELLTQISKGGKGTLETKITQPPAQIWRQKKKCFHKKTKGRRVRNHVASFEKLPTTTHDHFSALYTEGHVAYSLAVEQMLDNI